MVDTIFETVASCLNITNVLLVSVVVLAYLVYRSVRKPAGMPPGPNPYPFIGNILTFRTTPVLEVFGNYGKKYGNLFSLKIGQWWVVVLNDVELMRDALKKKPIDFADRPVLFSFETMTEGYKDIVFSNYSESWKLHRKLSHSAIRQFASSRKLEKLVEEASGKVAKHLDEFEGKPLDPRELIGVGIYNILTSLSFGEIYDFDDPRLHFFINISKEIFGIMGQGFVADFIPIAKYFPTPGLRKFRKLLADYIGRIHQYFEEHRKTYDPDNIRDMCDSLIQAQQEAIDEGSEHISSLTDTHLCQTISDLFGAGTDTTITTLTWIVALMAENPDIQQKCADEIHKVIGRDQFPSLHDRGNLPYCEATMMEVLRYSSIVPLGVPLATHCDTTLRGYSIPKGTLVLVNLQAIHFDKQYWDEPEKFNPDHFLDETGSIRQHPDSFMPFSAGKRSCLGEALAKSELFLLFSWFLQNYEFSKVPGKEDMPLIELDPWGPLVRLPKPYEVVVKKRPVKSV